MGLPLWGKPTGLSAPTAAPVKTHGRRCSAPIPCAFPGYHQRPPMSGAVARSPRAGSGSLAAGKAVHKTAYAADRPRPLADTGREGAPSLRRQGPCLPGLMPERGVDLSCGSAAPEPPLPNLTFLNHAVGVRSQSLGRSFLEHPYPDTPSLSCPRAHRPRAPRFGSTLCHARMSKQTGGIKGPPCVLQQGPRLPGLIQERCVDLYRGSAAPEPPLPNLTFLNHAVGVRSQFLGRSFLEPPYPAAPSLPFPSQDSTSTGHRHHASALPYAMRGCRSIQGESKGPPVCFDKGRVCLVSCRSAV
jgi:hypothetical protein